MLIETLTGASDAITAETQVRDQISVSRIKSPNDNAVQGLIELYATLFPDDGTHYKPELIIELCDSKYSLGKHIKVDNIVLVAKFRDDIVGFVIAQFYPEYHKAIISYMGINKNILEARRIASIKLLKRIKDILYNDKSDFLFFELYGIRHSLPQEEGSKQKARATLFKKIVKSLDIQAYELQFDYQCPKVTLTDESHEYPSILLCIPIWKKLLTPVPKQIIIDFLNFLYLCSYGDIYPIIDPKFNIYQEYLRQKIKYYEESLPNFINAV